MSSSAQEFKQLLLTAIQHGQALHGLLLEEQALLQIAGHSIEQLEAITAQKEQLLYAIEQDIQQRQAFLARQTCTTDEQGVATFLAEHPPAIAQALGQGWKQLASLLTQVQAANQINARLIQRGVRHCDQLLKIMKTNQGQVKVYNPTGSAGHLSVPRHLGQA